ncbi:MULTISPECIES: trigger factor [Thermoactinomyces]|jgi:trigger factor|uniref:Trigger factor n=1 Tax=Thermoactinomyces vulgaris TaxID=2026 RepID=A0ABS0QEE7_THEVU|nr:MULTISPECIES: trigger factor [Thermoactinomyces]KFZ41196.1 trigger factor [Thermoactinomyces sp. Gus2-1]KYQ87625.1 trigger factor [Thermoactinomyces sp. AS95]MBA4550181.1 trigger factor [Thermoactinomyces vulgaris]MBA4595592.1 trigger factor [Thermoactinomyces vulgaris]MBH8582065.1 trigger factor [Thermoactinomyces sp. CICC 10735]
MKASWEKTEKNKGILTVETDEQSVQDALDQAFKKVVKQVNVPGFRKGKVPRAIFEKRFGVEVLYQDALDILLPKAYEEAVEETGIVPVDRPEIDIEQLEKGKSLIFKATVTVKPEVELGEYKGLEVEVDEEKFAVKPEDVEKELERMQKQQGQLEPVEEGAVEKGDRVIIDFEGFVDGEPFEGGKAEQYTLEVGSGTFIPGFEDQLIGMKAGEEKEIQVTFPEEYHVEDLKGKPATFKVKLHEIKRMNLPELDDEFAQDVSEFDTLEELKADIEKNMKEKAEKDKENFIRNELVEKAAQNATVEIPEVMIENETENMLRQFEQRLMYQGLNLETYAQFTGQDQEALKDQFKEDAEKRVRADLVLEAIAKEEQIEVKDEEVEEEIKQMAEEMGREADEVRRILENQGALDSVKDQLRMKKTIDLLVSNSKNKA